MKVFIAGASGAIGKRLVPLLVRAGHAVVGMTRTPGKVTAIRAAGAQAAVVDALDTAAVIAALQDAKPEVVVHELTAIPQRLNIRDFDGEFASTNRLRTEGTDNLLMGAQKAGVRRFVAQSYAAWPYAREGGPVKTEIDPLDPDPPAGLRETLKAIRHLESRVLAAQGMDGVVLRYGAFYGPGTSIGEGGSFLEEVRRRRFPVVGGGSGVWSFLHIEDAAGATLSAIERGRPGVYNIVDDDPAPVSEWLPALAAAIGAGKPRRVPGFVARFIVGQPGLIMMTQIRGASNAKAKRELGWHPMWQSWRQGFRKGLVDRADKSAA